MSKVYHVGIRWIKSEINDQSLASVENSLQSIGEWVRLNAYDWYVFSDKTATDIWQKLSTLFRTEDSILVIGIDLSDYNGWAPPWLWDWLRNKKEQISSQSITQNALANALRGGLEPFS